MAATFLRMLPGVGKRKSVESTGIFLQRRLDLARIPLVGEGPDNREKQVMTESVLIDRAGRLLLGRVGRFEVVP